MTGEKRGFETEVLFGTVDGEVVSLLKITYLPDSVIVGESNKPMTYDAFTGLLEGMLNSSIKYRRELNEGVN